MAVAEAQLNQEGNDNVDYTAVAAVEGGDVVSLPDGRAAVVPTDIAAGDKGSASTCGIYTVTKTATQVWLPGAKLWWDHSANAATCIPQYADDDFYLGTAYEDVASATTTGKVQLNNHPACIIDTQDSGGDTAVVLTSGTPYLVSRGGSLTAAFSATAEAQKLDWLSKRSFPIDSNWILEADIEVVTNADADVGDLNVGVANATHASDADTIGESVFIHLDMGGSLNILAESDDGTTEVAATDTTVDWVVGTPFHIAIDGRDETDIQIYVNGVLVLGGSTFTLTAATGPLKALFHLEKTSNDSPGVVSLDSMTVRIANE